MKKNILYLYLLTVSLTSSLQAQDIIQVPHEKAVDVSWQGDEKQYFSQIWDTEVVTNVSVPTMQVFKPTNPNGTAVIVAPGGGLYGLSIESEGNMVAKWLSKKGITAFVLKYRLVPTGEDGIKEITDEGTNNPAKIGQRIKPVLPLSIADGLSAVAYVREHANEYGVDPAKIGFMGFSAGGAVTMGVGYYAKKLDRPDFIVPVYPWTTAFPVQEAPANAPKMLVICATDDPLGLAKGSIELYNSWLNRGYTPALHMYAKGGHGFGMKSQGLPSDSWIERFYDWADAEGIIAKVPKG
ncbi:MAG: 1,4-beta-xylanase [Pseudozobellia sp.]|nr:1,4-beta-xylanase [Pseudozobellia sp.]MBG49801.1 1,4-beta-xylanase [Pseudozobellia sp.]|tara:strand:+ start:635 stop:1522 length:888 start_codon:yes stop_codon:yes gene_type:complete